MEDNRQLQNIPNGLVLAGGGVAILIFKGIFLNPVSRIILAVAAIGWGAYQLVKNPENKTPGLASIASGAGLLVLGGLVQGLAGVAGVGLIIAGGISWISGFFRKSRGDTSGVS